MAEAAPDLEFYRAQLLELRAELTALEDTGTAAAATVELDQTKMGRLTRMDALQAQAMSQATNQRRAQTLRAIAAALQRIEREVYGDCQDCAEAIGDKRLTFDPTASLCITCASSRERNA